MALLPDHKLDLFHTDFPHTPNTRVACPEEIPSKINTVTLAVSAVLHEHMPNLK